MEAHRRRDARQRKIGWGLWGWQGRNEAATRNVGLKSAMVHKTFKLDAQGYNTGDRRRSRAGGYMTMQNGMRNGAAACKSAICDGQRCDDE